MKIRALFITRKSEPTMLPELIEAWDEYGLDENPEGANEAYQKALDSIGSDLDQFRYVDIEINETTLDGLFQPYQMNGDI